MFLVISSESLRSEQRRELHDIVPNEKTCEEKLYFLFKTKWKIAKMMCNEYLTTFEELGLS
jgi:hypothetical protein